ncbi:MAG: hypothetical protein ABSH15_02995 [Verrucomicrobiota bacterium]|jgi:hypothetical protein
MATSTEQIAIGILEALEKEWQREPSIVKCRPSSIVLGEVMAAHGLANEEITKTIMFMAAPERQYLQICNREDGQAILPSDAGLRMLGAIQLHRIDEAKAEAAAQKAEAHRRLDVRLKIYPIIIALLLLLVAYLSYRLSASGHTATPP